MIWFYRDIERFCESFEGSEGVIVKVISIELKLGLLVAM